MYYNPSTQTLVEVITKGVNGDGDELTTEHIRALSTLKGQTLEGGKFVAQITFAFIMGPTEAEPWLEDIKRFGLRCRTLDQETAEDIVLHEGIRAAPEAEGEGTLLPVLREVDDGRIERFMRRRLITSAVPQGPWLTFGMDHPRTLSPIVEGQYEGALEDLEEVALKNLAARPFEVRVVDEGLLAVEGEYALEAVILLPAVSKALEEQLGADTGLLVAAPSEGPALVCAVGNHDLASVLILWCRDRFDDADARRVSRVPLVVMNGQAVGFIDGKPA